jgi:hypothetical protein
MTADLVFLPRRYDACPVDLPLECRCGRVRGLASAASPSSGFRFVCYCTDCKTFSRFLDRPDVLDTAGGTDIFHMPMGQMKVAKGVDAVASRLVDARARRAKPIFRRSQRADFRAAHTHAERALWKA